MHGNPLSGDTTFLQHISHNPSDSDSNKMAFKKTNAVKKTSNACKSLRTKTKKGSGIEFADNAKIKMETSAAQAFATFSTGAVLNEGLNVIRALGSGKYEIINLDIVSQNDIGSVEMAEIVKSVPERQAALSIDKKRWDAAILKCDIAVRITNHGLFRFFALPAELQKTIHELVVVNQKGMNLRTRNKEYSKPFEGLSWMLTCREVHEECKKLFLQNNFHLDHSAIVKLRQNDFAKNLFTIELEWEGKWADATIMTDIACYPNLQVLHIRFWGGAIHWNRHTNRNRLFQNEQEIKWFSKLRGFDELTRLRGFTKVTFDYYGDIEPDYKPEAPKAKKAFEEFLNRELTKPKPLSIAARLVKGRSKVRADVATTDTDDDGSDEEYIPRPTRSRRGMIIEMSHDEDGW